MSGLAFYATKALAISLTAVTYLIILAIFSYALAKVIPDDPSEPIEMTFGYLLAYVALASCAVWVTRTQLKRVPELF